MKKQIITILAVSGLAVSAFAQGSINIDGSPSPAAYVTIQGVNATVPADILALSQTFNGNVSVAIYYAASGTISGAQLTAINSYLNISGGAASAIALLGSDGFVEASTTTSTSGIVGTVTGAVVTGTFNFTGGTATIGLTGVPSSTSAYLALVLTATTAGTYGGAIGWEGVIAFANGTGGNLGATPAGTAANLTGWGPTGENLVLSPVPEPATMALMGLGGLSLMLFRRKVS